MDQSTFADIGIATGAVTALWIVFKFLKDQLAIKDENYRKQIIYLETQNKELADNNREDYKETAEVLRDVSGVLGKVVDESKRYQTATTNHITRQSNNIIKHIDKVLKLRDGTK